jgi:flagellar protein FlgJ
MIDSLHSGKYGQGSLLSYTAEPASLPLPGRSDIDQNPLKSKDNSDARKQLVEAGQQFDAFFVSYLLKVMRETVPEGALANKQGAYFYSFYDQEIGLRAAQAGGIGITQMVKEYAEKYFAPAPVQPSSSSR